MRNVSYTVTTTPTLVVPADDQNRTVYLHSGTGSVYLGNGNVTSSNGLHMPNGSTMSMFIPARETLYAVTGASSQTFIVVTPDTDS